VTKQNFDPVLAKLKHLSFQWYNEYEKTLFECSNFNEYELYQQPFAHVFICSITDDIGDMENLKLKENIPQILHEGIYEYQMPTLLIVLNDRSSEVLPPEVITKKYNLLAGFKPPSLSIQLDINTNTGEELPDIWVKYLSRIDYYSLGGHVESIIRGKLISADEREVLQLAFYKFFNEHIKPHFQKLAIELDDEISNNKKGIKNNLFSIFKKSDKIEYVNHYNIYKVFANLTQLTPIEKKVYLLSLVQFYLRDYEGAVEHLKILMSDLKVKLS
jgi:hypothetical protein